MSEETKIRGGEEEWEEEKKIQIGIEWGRWGGEERGRKEQICSSDSSKDFKSLFEQTDRNSVEKPNG